MRPTHVATLLARDASTLEAAGDRPFLLRGGCAWLVEAGHVDVFRVPLRDGEAAGARQHLFRVADGSVLLGSDTEHADRPAGFLAVGAPGTRLIPVSHARLRQVADARAHAGEVAELIDGWIGQLCASIAPGVPPDGCIELDPGEHVLAERCRVRPAGRVAWFRRLNGDSLLLGRAGLRLDGHGCTPIAPALWIETAPDTRLTLEPTDALLGRPEFWDGLARLHDLVLDCATRMAEDAAAAERERLRLKAASDRRAFGRAITRLASTLDGHAAEAAPADAAAAGDMDPLFAACRQVGAAAGIHVRPAPRDRGTATPRDPLAEIAQASRIRIRQVLLRGEWWRQDGGPFLAHLAEDGRPVALLPCRGPGYRIHDPAHRTEQRVTPELAAGIDPRAYAFYRPFDDAAISIRDLLRFGFQGCRRDLLTVLLMSVAAGLLSLLPPIATGLVFNDIIPSADRPQLLQLTLGLLVIAVATAMFNATRTIALVRIAGRMEAQTQAAVWDRLLALPLPFFRPYTAGDLAVRAMGIDAIRQILSGATVTALIGGVVALFHFALLFHYSVPLAWWAVLIIGLTVAATALAGRLQLTHERVIAGIRSRLAGMVLQFLTSISKLRVAAAEVQAFALWADRFTRQRRLQFRARTIGNALAALNAAVPVVANLILFGAAVSLLSDGESLRTGDFLAFLSSFGTCLAGMLSASAALVATLGIIPLYEQARPILTTRPEVDRGKADPGTLTGDFEVQHLRFRYQVDGPTVLRDVTFSAKAGEFIALVGPSGSGKSTILRLLLGFETPEAGAIYYDGQDFAGLDRNAVRRQIGVVLQNGRIMAGDIFTNIVGSSLATLEDAWNAAAMAGLADDIRAMPMGMHTVISEGGGTLSGGQRQRLLIARALVQRPRILFFDEATSALDNRTQDTVTTSLDRLRATRIVIAHRLSTILRADRIHVIDRGRIVETGTYAELLDAGGLFAELARRQIA